MLNRGRITFAALITEYTDLFEQLADQRWNNHISLITNGLFLIG